MGSVRTYGSIGGGHYERHVSSSAFAPPHHGSPATC